MSFLAAALPLLLSLMSGADFAYDSYRPVDLATYADQVLREHPDMLNRFDGKDTAWIHPLDKLAATVVNSGQRRPLAGFKAKTVEGWLRADWPAQAGKVKEEILVRAGERDFWVPIQEILVPFLEKEACPGAQLELYLIFIGATDQGLLFIANEFKVQGTSGCKAPPASPAR
jgi:hypothetical protein